MALSKQKVLTSCKLLFIPGGLQFVEVEWSKQILEDGVIIGTEPHRGAYPVDPVTGNPDQSVQTDMGIKLSKLFSNAGDNALAQLVIANANITTLQGAKDQALADLQTAKDSLASIKTTLRAAKVEKQALRQRLKDNAIADSDIPVVPVDEAVIAASAQTVKLT